MDDSEVIDKAAEVFFRNAIKQAVDSTFYNLQSLLGIEDGGFHPDIALHLALQLDEHINTLVKDCCDIFSNKRMNARM